MNAHQQEQQQQQQQQPASDEGGLFGYFFGGSKQQARESAVGVELASNPMQAITFFDADQRLPPGLF